MQRSVDVPIQDSYRVTKVKKGKETPSRGFEMYRGLFLNKILRVQVRESEKRLSPI